jgi:cold shock protein
VIGKVKWFDTKRGYGFIEANNDNYFVHYSEIKRAGFKNLDEGDKVDFKPVSGSKGWQASDVSVLKDN